MTWSIKRNIASNAAVSRGNTYRNTSLIINMIAHNASSNCSSFQREEGALVIKYTLLFETHSAMHSSINSNTWALKFISWFLLWE